MDERSRFRVDMAAHFPFVIKAIAVPSTLSCDAARPLKYGEAKWLIEKAAETPDHYALIKEIGSHLELWGHDEEPTVIGLQHMEHWDALKTIIKHLGETRTHAFTSEVHTPPKPPEQLTGHDTLTTRYDQIKLRIQGIDTIILNPNDPELHRWLYSMKKAVADLNFPRFLEVVRMLERRLGSKTDATWNLACF